MSRTALPVPTKVTRSGVTAVTVSAAGVYTFNQPTVYRSSMKIVVGQGGGIVPSQIGSSAQQLTQTLSDLLQSGIVSRTVIARLHLHMKPPELLSHLHVITKPDTSVLQVLYDDQSAAARHKITITPTRRFLARRR